jgi:branched-chain amino acid transport system permease protein
MGVSFYLQQLINGVGLGCTYALIAIGYALVFGVLGVLNMAHGDIFMVGAYIGLVSIIHLKVSPVLAVCFAFGGTFILGMVMERLTIKPLKGMHLAPLITTIGVGIILQDVVRIVFGPNQLRIPVETVTLELGPISIPSLVLINLVVSFLLMIFLAVFIKRTKTGRAIQAVAENSEIAGAYGINVSMIMMFTVGLASALGGMAGVLLGMTLGSITPFIGANFGLKGLIILIVGGVGNIYGAMFVGLLLGITEIFSVALLSSVYRDILAFVLLIVILLFRPTGLFGVQIKTK